MQSIKLFALGLTVILAAAARAQTNTAPINAPSAAFKSADTNLNGLVGRAEFGGYIKKSTFEKLDADKDGAITLEEWKAVDHSPEAEKHFAVMDQDRNGRVSCPEFTNAPEWRNALNDSFNSLDQDRDGYLAPGDMPGLPRFRLLSVNF